MERVGACRHNGPGRPRKSPTVGDSPRTVADVAEEFGVSEQTARNHLKAHDDYEASAPEFKKKVDAGEMTPRKARQATRRVRRG